MAPDFDELLGLFCEKKFFSDDVGFKRDDLSSKCGRECANYMKLSVISIFIKNS